MKCEVVQEKLSCFLDGVIDEATMEMIEDHLNGCSECRAELAALQALTASMNTAFEVDPPASLKSSIYEAIEREPVVSRECESVMSFLSEMLDGELAKADHAMAMRHIETCEACAREHVMMQRTVAAVGSLCEVDPPLTLKSQIAAAIATEKKSSFRLSNLIRKTRQALQPAGLRWAVGSVAAVAIVASVLISPMRQSDVTMVTERPTSTIDADSAPTSTPEAVAAEPLSPVAQVVMSEPATKVVISRAPKRTEPRSAASNDEVEREQIAMTPPARTNGERNQTSAANGNGVAPAAPLAASLDASSDAKPVGTARVAERAVPLVEAPDDAPKAVAAAPEVKPTEVQIAAQEPFVSPQDDQAMIRSLKQQLRMKQKGEGITVDLVDLRF